MMFYNQSWQITLCQYNLLIGLAIRLVQFVKTCILIFTAHNSIIKNVDLIVHIDCSISLFRQFRAVFQYCLHGVVGGAWWIKPTCISIFHGVKPQFLKVKKNRQQNDLVAYIKSQHDLHSTIQCFNICLCISLFLGSFVNEP